MKKSRKKIYPIVNCHDCGGIAVDKFRGKPLCRVCLCPEVDPFTEDILRCESLLAAAEWRYGE